MRHTLDESAHAGDLELIGMLPAELRRLCLAWKALDFAAGPGSAVGFGSRHGSTEPPIPDEHRASLRKFRDKMRKRIGVVADDIQRHVRQVRRCKCGEENSWDDAWCGESKPEGKGCGRTLVGEPGSRKGSSGA